MLDVTILNEAELTYKNNEVIGLTVFSVNALVHAVPFVCATQHQKITFLKKDSSTV